MPAVRSQSQKNEHPGHVWRQRREAAAVTLSEVSYRVGLDIGALSRFERGQRDISQAKLDLLAHVVNAALLARSQALELAMSEESVAV